MFLFVTYIKTFLTLCPHCTGWGGGDLESRVRREESAGCSLVTCKWKNARTWQPELGVDNKKNRPLTYQLQFCVFSQAPGYTHTLKRECVKGNV